jgi:hypothetical protein
VSRRLRTALSLYESGVAMKRAQLRRQDAAASEQEIANRLAIWLRTREVPRSVTRRQCDAPLMARVVGRLPIASRAMAFGIAAG